MAVRYYGLDVKDFFLSHAQDATEGINAMVATINTERSTTVEDVRSFTDFWSKRNALPEFFVDVQGSEILNEDDHIGGGGDEIGSTTNYRFPGSTPEVFTVNVFIRQKSNRTDFTDQMEIYGEALYRVFHKYCNEDIMWILATAAIRDEIQTEENQTYKVIGYSFDVRIDKS